MDFPVAAYLENLRVLESPRSQWCASMAERVEEISFDEGF
jgi:hypothetical protein